MARLLNEGVGMNFFEFVNYYRIKEFIELVESKKFKNFTFMAIASEAGFNSKSTFNKAFRDIMGKTPRQYFA
jgi:AraC-like DNA-binding protein